MPGRCCQATTNAAAEHPACKELALRNGLIACTALLQCWDQAKELPEWIGDLRPSRSYCSQPIATMQRDWGARASCPLFSASGQEHPVARAGNHPVERSCAETIRRDADWGDRDGRAPNCQLHHSHLKVLPSTVDAMKSAHHSHRKQPYRFWPELEGPQKSPLS